MYHEDIYRLKVCQWAYGWSDEELIQKISEFLFRDGVSRIMELDSMMLATRDTLDIAVQDLELRTLLPLPKEVKHRCYGKKYIKRKHRW